jgi:hypothetical protein
MTFTAIPEDELELIKASIAEIKSLLQAKQPEEKGPTWLPKKEGCKRLNVCTKTFDTYLKNGTIPFTQFKGKIYVKASDIEAHLEKYYVTKN